MPNTDQTAELRDKIRTAWPARALTHGRGMHVPPVRDGGNTAACIDLAVELATEHFAPAPCVMTHTPPFDFAQCETHDETFPLGGTCRFDGRDMIEVLFEAEYEQRGRAVRAELERDRAEAALARVQALVDEADSKGCASGWPFTVDRVRAALQPELEGVDRD